MSTSPHHPVLPKSFEMLDSTGRPFPDDHLADERTALASISVPQTDLWGDEAPVVSKPATHPRHAFRAIVFSLAVIGFAALAFPEVFQRLKS